MYYLYLLKDQRNKLYIGYTANLKRRISEHERSSVFTTKRMNNPKLIYYEAYIGKELAIEREKQLKRFGSAYYSLIKRLDLK